MRTTLIRPLFGPRVFLCGARVEMKQNNWAIDAVV